MKHYIVYAYSTDVIAIGDENFEVDGAYVILNTCQPAESEEAAKEMVAFDRNINLEYLEAQELK